jgi:molybdopterin molybdotransferase
MISASDALNVILGRVPVLGTVTLSVRRALGHALAGKITAAVDVPHFDNSAMDGYAVIAADIARAPAVLRVAGETAAGAGPGGGLRPGEALRIMTGAPVPGGADAVVPHELTAPAGDDESGRECVSVAASLPAGANIRRAGSDIRKGSEVFDSGHEIRPFEQGVLASMGIGYVTVHRRPSVYLAPTGNELRGQGPPLGPGKIRESNSAALGALLRAEGCGLTGAEIIPDDPPLLAAAIAAGLRSDMLVTIGGVSAGKYDLMPRLFAEAGVELVFHRVNIKPGMPLYFGMKGEVPVFGLPGNPVSAVVTFSQFVRPAIRRMSGRRDPAARRIVRARLGTTIEKKDGKRHYLRGILDTSGDEATVLPAGTQESHAASVLARANCLIILPEGKNHFGPPDVVETELI